MEMKVPQLKFDVEKFRSLLKTKFMAVLEEFEPILIEEMQKQIDRNGDMSGKSEWREKVKADLQYIKDDISTDTIFREVGLKYSGQKTDYESMRAFVIAYGTGYRSKGGGEPMMSKPGQAVWDSDLSEQHTSTARAQYYLPDSWNRPPTDFFDAAVRNQRMEYVKFIDARKDEIITEAFNASLSFV